MEGHCHCGAVRRQSDAAPVWSCYCHCADCRRNCAAPVTAFLGLPHGAVCWTATAPRIYRSSPKVERLFCGTCGTPMAYRHADDRVTLHLYIATLADPAAVAPRYHVFDTERLPWLVIDDTLPRHPGDPNG